MNELDKPRLWFGTVVANYMGIHINTLKRIPPEQLPYYAFGNKGDRRYLQADVDAYLDARRVDTTAEAERRRHAQNKPAQTTEATNTD